jgi:hypothetical protein
MKHLILLALCFLAINTKAQIVPFTPNQKSIIGYWKTPNGGFETVILLSEDGTMSYNFNEDKIANYRYNAIDNKLIMCVPNQYDLNTRKCDTTQVVWKNANEFILQDKKEKRKFTRTDTMVLNYESPLKNHFVFSEACEKCISENKVKAKECYMPYIRQQRAICDSLAGEISSTIITDPKKLELLQVTLKALKNISSITNYTKPTLNDEDKMRIEAYLFTNIKTVLEAFLQP